MDIDISEEPMTSLPDYARIPIAFEVDRVLDVSTDADGAAVLVERPVDIPYIKDYDAIEREGPTRWPRMFDVSNWGLITARSDGRCVGGAVIAFNTPGVNMLDGRSDLAVLWDIRVDPEARGEGIGSLLFSAVEAWAEARGCRQLKIETQNINLAACRFYQLHGCILGGINRAAYPELPDEIQLLWYKNLTTPGNEV
jgi:GNAT superfamily N-acetyltransferase